MEPPTERRWGPIGWALWLVAATAVGLLWARPDLWSTLRSHTRVSVEADRSCDPAAAPCAAALPAGPVTLSIDPPGAPPDQPLQFTVTAPEGTTPVAVQLTGRSMSMGLVEVPLAQVDGVWIGTARLPVCTLAEMEWAADVLLEPAAQATFTVTSRKGGVVIDGSLVEAVEPTWPLFTVDTAEGPVDLADWKGSAVVVYFGYTHCPDICPTTLATVAQAIHQLPEPQQERVRVVMVTLDPERDDLPRLQEYVRWFDPRFVAGQVSPLDEVAPAWGMSWRKVALPDSALGYAVDHGTDAYLVGPDGRLDRVLPHGLPATAVSNALREALQPD